MEHTPPLPSGFNINGYLIQSLKQTDSLCHVYYASDADHVQYLLREFCPQGLAVRDPESGKLRYPENTDIEREVLPLKNDFEAQFRTGSLGEIPALGTLYLAYAIPGGPAAAARKADARFEVEGKAAVEQDLVRHGEVESRARTSVYPHVFDRDGAGRHVDAGADAQDVLLIPLRPDGSRRQQDEQDECVSFHGGR